MYLKDFTAAMAAATGRGRKSRLHQVQLLGPGKGKPGQRADDSGPVLPVTDHRVLGPVKNRNIQDPRLILQIVFQHVRLTQGHSAAVQMHPHPAAGFM